MLFGRKKELLTEKENRIRKAKAEMQSFLDEGKHKFDEICERTNRVLMSSGKPAVSNTVRFASVPYFFPELQSYQVYFEDWEIWTNEGQLYIYRSAVTDYPEDYAEADAPAIAQIPISSIRYFRIEGIITSETKVTGGVVSQNRHTGRVSQTAIKTRNVNHDGRIVRMCIMDHGVVRTVDFEKTAYDILGALLPEKMQ